MAESFRAANSGSLKTPDFVTTRLLPSSAGFTIDSRNSRDVSLFQSPWAVNHKSRARTAGPSPSDCFTVRTLTTTGA